MARSLDDLKLTERDRRAVQEADQELKARFPVTRLIIFGSVARDEADEESDLDILVLTSQEVPRATKHAMFDVIFDINLRWDTNLSILCVDEESWNNGVLAIAPIHWEVERDGVPV